MESYKTDIAAIFHIKPAEVPIYLIQPAKWQDQTKLQKPGDDDKVTAALSNYASQNTNARLIPTSDLKGYIDGIHSNTVSRIEIGNRIAKQIEK